MRIFVFGDSITYGNWDYEGGGWVNRLRNFLDTKSLVKHKFDYRLYNLGISGDTSKDLLYRFEFEIKNRLKDNEESLVIIEIGINDSLFFQDKKKLTTSPKIFRKNIQKLIKLSRKFTEKIIFVGPTSVVESKVNPLPWRKEVSYKNGYISKYNEVIKSVCKENKVFFIDIFAEWINLNYEILLEDGVHPNSEGHKKIFEIVKESLINNKFID
jgi:lysophospholipase L1-like esterase